MLIISTPTGFMKVMLSTFLEDDFNPNEYIATGLSEPEDILGYGKECADEEIEDQESELE